MLANMVSYSRKDEEVTPGLVEPRSTQRRRPHPAASQSSKITETGPWGRPKQIERDRDPCGPSYGRSSLEISCPQRRPPSP